MIVGLYQNKQRPPVLEELSLRIFCILRIAKQTIANTFGVYKFTFQTVSMIYCVNHANVLESTRVTRVLTKRRSSF